MNILVCVKQILDPEIPPAKFRVNSETREVIPPEGIPPVINPFDSQAVEAALRIKDKHSAKITAISMGSGSAIDVVRHALSMGVDEGILIDDDAFQGSDSFSTAYILTRAIQKIGDYDLILCGRQAADWDAGEVGSIIAENLGIALITLAKAIEVVNGKLRVERVTLEGFEVFESPLPALITISNELGQPRLPSGWGIISAVRKNVPTWTAQDISVAPSQIGATAARSKLLSLSIPARERTCKMVGGKDVAEAAANLALTLREAKII